MAQADTVSVDNDLGRVHHGHGLLKTIVSFPCTILVLGFLFQLWFQ